MRLVLGALLVAATTIAVPAQVSAAPVVITFDSLSAFDPETNSEGIQPLADQFLGDGVEFLEGWAWFAFVSLNETDFPPKSGEAVASNADRDSAGNAIPGTLEIAFTQPFYGVGGYFTYSSLLTLEFFNGSDLLGIRNSPDLSNIGTSTFIEFVATMPITRLLVTSRTQFTLDDLTLTADAPGQAAVPEPGSILLLGGGLASLWRRQRARRRQ